MRIKHHPGRAIEASLSLEQNSAMGALYEANWDKVQSSMNSLIASHHELGRGDDGKSTPFRELEEDEGLPDEDEEDPHALKQSSTVLKAFNGYKPSTIRRIRGRQFPEWDELKESNYSEENLDTIRPLSSFKPFANTHMSGNGHRQWEQHRNSPPKEYRMYMNLASSESFRNPITGGKPAALKRSNTVAIQSGNSADVYRPRTLDRRDVFQRLKEKVRQQKPIDEFSDHQRNYGFPTTSDNLERSNTRYRSSCDSKNSKSLESISTFPDYRRGSDDSESNLSIGDRMTCYRSSSDLCSRIYRDEGDQTFRNIPKATATLSRNKSVKGRPILDDIPPDLLTRPSSNNSSKSKKVGFGKMLYNTISAGTKFPRALLKNHFSRDSADSSEYDGFSFREMEPSAASMSPSPHHSPPHLSPSSSKSTSSPASSTSSSFKKLFRSRSRTLRRQQVSSSSSDSADSFLVPTPEERPLPPPLPAPRIPMSSSAAAASMMHSSQQSIVPVHTYARKRRTGNLNAEPIYGNLEEVYGNDEGK